jgi:hypothetical protein
MLELFTELDQELVKSSTGWHRDLVALLLTNSSLPAARSSASTLRVARPVRVPRGMWIIG